MSGKSWQISVLTILALAFVFPVGLLLMWLYAPWRLKWKWGWTCVFALLVVLIIIGSVTGGVTRGGKSGATLVAFGRTSSGLEITQTTIARSRQIARPSTASMVPQPTSTRLSSATPQPSPTVDPLTPQASDHLAANAPLVPGTRATFLWQVHGLATSVEVTLTQLGQLLTAPKFGDAQWVSLVDDNLTELSMAGDQWSNIQPSPDLAVAHANAQAIFDLLSKASNDVRAGLTSGDVQLLDRAEQEVRQADAQLTSQSPLFRLAAVAGN